jgi:UDP-N-acetyl-2-amino-2-deoxyglucuronate dehydrogenase
MAGVAGYVAPRHLRAIHETGHQLVAALDTSDSVGVLDRFAPAARFFTDPQAFERHLTDRAMDGRSIDYLSVCTPNYLHFEHCRLGLAAGAHVICEKPLVLEPAHLDALSQLEGSMGRRVFTVLQLRFHPVIRRLREALPKQPSAHVHDVELACVMSRGHWYDVSWKGCHEKSGGLLMNVGIHLFDMLTWLFGATLDMSVSHAEPRRMKGFLVLERARVRWSLSIAGEDLPDEARIGGKQTLRTIRVEGTSFDFSEGFEDLHTIVYEEILAGRGHGIGEARSSLELAARLSRAS